MSVNRPRVRFAIENGTVEGLPARHTEPGVNYLEVCRNSSGESSEGAIAAHDGIMAVMDGTLPIFALEYPCHSPNLKRWFTMTATPLGTDNKRVVVSHTNITERKLAEEALKLSEKRFSTVFHASPVSTAITRLSDSKLIDVNAAWLKVVGLSREEAIGRTPFELNLWIDPGARDKLIRILLEQNTLHDFEVQLRHKSGIVSHMLLSAELIELGGERCVLSLAQDITERRRSAEALKEREEIYSAIVGQASEGIVLIDFESFRFVEFNDAACHGLGYSREEFARLTLFDLQGVFTGEQVAERIQSIAKAGHGSLENQQRRKDGTLRYVLISNQVVSVRDRRYIVGIWKDITEQKQAEHKRHMLEAQLRQAQKMEAVGTLAGGIAHEFNNILGIILDNAELAKDGIPERSRAKHNLDEIKTASLRARDVVRQLLTFSRGKEEKRKPLNLAQIVKEAIKFLRASIPSDIEIRQNIAEKCHSVIADPTQIHRVMLNLGTNAAHAMEESGGILEFSLQNITFDNRSYGLDPKLRPGEYVMLQVSDTGRGIATEILGRIFDPYFTTKDVGKGTGMGLSVVHGIVESHGGSIQVASSPSIGTTFKIFFPATKEKDGAVLEMQEELPTGSERILFLDDERAIATLGRLMLEKLGYRVKAETNATRALELFTSNPEQFDLIITDTTMPGITGDRLIKKVIEIRPGMMTFLCTGYSQKVDEESARTIGAKAYALKPLDMTMLAKTVRKVLDEST